MDKIIIKNLKVYSYHGVNDEEKIRGQEFVVDAILELDLSTACDSDNINDTVSYAKVIKTIGKVMGRESYNLLEKLAMQIIKEIFLLYTAVESVEICVKKPMAPIKANFDYVAVNLKRYRSDML